MQQAEMADSTAAPAASGGKFENISTQPIELISKALSDQDGQIAEMATIGAMIRTVILAIDGICNLHGTGEGPKRALNDVTSMLYVVDDQLERSIKEVDALHTIAYRNAHLLRVAA